MLLLIFCSNAVMSVVLYARAHFSTLTASFLRSVLHICLLEVQPREFEVCALHLYLLGLVHFVHLPLNNNSKELIIIKSMLPVQNK